MSVRITNTGETCVLNGDIRAYLELNGKQLRQLQLTQTHLDLTVGADEPVELPRITYQANDAREQQADLSIVIGERAPILVRQP